jgi:hypothetical protein
MEEFLMAEKKSRRGRGSGEMTSGMDDTPNVEAVPDERSVLDAKTASDLRPNVPKVDVVGAKSSLTEEPSPIEVPRAEERSLAVTTPEETKETGTVLKGAADKWLCIAKAYNEKEGWMKSTKAMQVGASGCLIQVTTQQRNPDGTWAVAEAVCFAPNVSLAESEGQAKFMM